MKSLPLKGKITSFAFGGNGILKNEEGMVVFIPFTAPEETVSYEIVKQKKRYAEGKLLQVLEPSPHRIEPRCPYFTKCGGCQLQHLDYPYQASLKKRAVQEALQRVYPEAKTEMVPATAPWSYRRRIHLTLKPLDKGFAAGYIAYDNESLIEIEQCPIFLPAKEPIFNQVREIAKQFDSEPGNSGKAALIKMDQGFLLHFHFKKSPKNAEKVLKEALKMPLCGIFLSAPGKEIRFGEEALMFTLEDLSFRYTPRAFIQNHPEESALIYHAIRDEIKEARPPVLLDLYSGIGITSLLASDYAGKIEAIEANREAIKLAQQNAETNNKKNVRFHLGLVEKKLPEVLSKKPFMAISNPPREGMEPSACTMLAESSIKKLIYISCHPATLARDLNVFKANGFVLKKSRAYDMFPQTGHVETVAFLDKK